MIGSRRITVALVGLVALVLLGWLVQDQLAGEQRPPVPGPESGLPVRPLSQLPPEVASTWHLVRQGGPFPFPRDDGQVFHNRERLLPAKESGYYREYTVRIPRSADRGPRRLVTGAGRELYYTDDHYRSFVRVDPER